MEEILIQAGLRWFVKREESFNPGSPFWVQGGTTPPMIRLCLPQVQVMVHLLCIMWYETPDSSDIMIAQIAVTQLHIKTEKMYKLFIFISFRCMRILSWFREGDTVIVGNGTHMKVSILKGEGYFIPKESPGLKL